jgi:hypothetical protein
MIDRDMNLPPDRSKLLVQVDAQCFRSLIQPHRIPVEIVSSRRVDRDETSFVLMMRMAGKRRLISRSSNKSPSFFHLAAAATSREQSLNSRPASTTVTWNEP